jgi:hypothetical protein
MATIKIKGMTCNHCIALGIDSILIGQRGGSSTLVWGNERNQNR